MGVIVGASTRHGLRCHAAIARGQALYAPLPQPRAAAAFMGRSPGPRKAVSRSTTARTTVRTTVPTRPARMPKY